MHGYSEWYWAGHGAGIVIWLIVIAWPIAKILSRAGYSGWWALISVVPLVNVVALWIFAYGRWPALDRP